jgi:hypothetical protein
MTMSSDAGGPELSAWFTRQARLSSKRGWYEVEGTEIKWFKGPHQQEADGATGA